MRHYHIELPYHIPSMFVSSAIDKLKALHEWDKLPRHLREKVEHALNDWCGLDLTQEDLDSISDPVWEEIATQLGVEWD